MANQSGQRGDGGANPGGTGPAVKEGGSAADPTAIQRELEQTRARLSALEQEKGSLQQSVQGLTRYKQEAETLRGRVEELESYAEAGYSPGTAEPAWDETRIKGVVAQSINDWWSDQQQQQQRQQQEIQAKAAERQKWLNQTAQDFPDSKDPENPLYKRAVEVFNDPQYGLSVEENVNGQALKNPKYPNAEHTAFSIADRLLRAESQGAQAAQQGAAFASTGGSSAGAATGMRTDGQLSDDEFMKMSPEERARYQEEQFKRKHGT